MSQHHLKKVTTVLVVDAIEPALPFWCERVGFSVTLSVPHGGDGGPIGFAILERDGVELMLQTRDSVREDVPALADEPNRASLFIEVDDVCRHTPR